jgi:predicted nucleic acid-binding protein
VILVDTSVWIKLFSKENKEVIPVEKLALLSTCPPIVQEVLQGVRDQSAFSKISLGFAALKMIGDPIPLKDYMQAVELYREGRRRGITIRSSVDCLIAAIAISHGHTVWHFDRDFTAIARFSDLKETSHI